MEAVREGVFYIIPQNIINQLTWQVIDYRATGSKDLDLDMLKTITKYSVRATLLLTLFRVALKMMTMSNSFGRL